MIEQRVICAYFGLLLTPQVGERRTTMVDWLGPREVRLTEVEPDHIPARWRFTVMLGVLSFVAAASMSQQIVSSCSLRSL